MKMLGKLPLNRPEEMRNMFVPQSVGIMKREIRREMNKKKTVVVNQSTTSQRHDIVVSFDTSTSFKVIPYLYAISSYGFSLPSMVRFRFTANAHTQRTTFQNLTK